MLSHLIIKSARCNLNSIRSLGTVNLKTFGSPKNALIYNATKASQIIPSAEEATVAIKASQVTYEDIRSIYGFSHANKNLGVAGTTAVGNILSVGSNVSNLSVGDNVFVVHNGTWSDIINIPTKSLYKINKLTIEESAFLPILLSAWAILTSYVPLKSGDTIIQYQKNGLIGLAINEVSKLLDIKVINVSSSEDLSKITVPALLGVTNIPGKPLQNLTKALSDNGIVVYFNEPIQPILSTEPISISVSQTIFNNKSVSGFDFNGWVNNNPDKVNLGIEFITNGFNNKKITLKPKVYKQSQYLEAIADVEKSGTLAVLKV